MARWDAVDERRPAKHLVLDGLRLQHERLHARILRAALVQRALPQPVVMRGQLDRVVLPALRRGQIQLLPLHHPAFLRGLADPDAELVHELDADVALREVGGELLGAGSRAVDDGHFGAALGREVLHEEAGHLTRADDHHAASLEAARGELHLHELGGGGGDGDGSGGDGRLRAHALPGGDGRLEETVEVAAEALNILAHLKHRLHYPDKVFPLSEWLLD